MVDLSYLTNLAVIDYSFLGPAAASVIIVGLFLKFLSTTLKELISTLKSLTRSNERVAKATEKAAKEAKQRNGHLAELAVENQEKNIRNDEAILEAIKEIKNGGK